MRWEAASEAGRKAVLFQLTNQNGNRFVSLTGCRWLNRSGGRSLMSPPANRPILWTAGLPSARCPSFMGSSDERNTIEH